MNKDNQQRRDFLKTGLTALGSAGALSLSQSCSETTDSGDMVKVLTPDGKVIEVKASEVAQLGQYEEYKVRQGVSGKKFVMVVDLARCQNAKKCVSSCNKNHLVSTPNEWLKIYSMQDNENSAPYWQPMMCQHCEKPPCVKVCPVDATFKREDGIVLIDNDRCIGCRFCMAACPYSTRVFNWGEPEFEMDLDSAMTHHHHSPETSVPAQKGTVDKCDFCPDMLAKGELPHCVTACPNSVFYFGDQYEDVVTNGSETVRLSELLKERAGYRMMEDFGTSPSVYYLPPVDRLFEYEEGLENFQEFNDTQAE